MPPPPVSEESSRTSLAASESVSPVVASPPADADFFVTRTVTPHVPPDNSARIEESSLSSFEVAPQQRSSRTLLIGVAAVVLLLVVGGGTALYLSMRSTPTDTPPQTNTGGQPGNTNGSGNAPPVDAVKTPAVLIPGGVFMMGRNDVSESSNDYNQFPAHSVSVKSFYLDKTEVTNAEYAEFVRATGHPAPSAPAAPYWTPWNGDNPPAGQEQWPVRNVSVANARAFAGWRSKRDNVTYRLPTEDEWEYAARNGGETTLYPWGNAWANDRASVNAGLPKPVGTYTSGATRAGALDMIGNVWEWTSSQASVYAGNKQLQLTADETGQVIMRGGSYRSQPSGDEAITAATRQWVSSDTKHPTIGFRLARDAP